MSRKLIRVMGWLLIVGCAAGIARAQQHPPTINVGNHLAIPGTANQQIDIYVEGGTGTIQASGINLAVLIGNGGSTNTDFPSPTPVNGPTITSVSLTAPGTPFATNNAGGTSSYAGPGAGSMQAEVTVNAATGSPVPNVTIGGPTDQLLAVITVDMTGFSFGTWTLDLGAWGNGIGAGNENDQYMEDYTSFSYSQTNDFGSPFIINEGSINMPEPDSLWLGLMAAAGLGIVAVRRQRACRG